MLLYAAISFHGFGHIAQTAPVVAELCRRCPGLRLVLRSSAPRRILAEHFPFPFEHLEAPADVAMAMADSLAVRPAASHAAALRFHRNWQERVTAEAEALARLAPDLVLANVSYLLPAAAARVGIPAAAMCSLNWADIFWSYCRDFAGAEAIHAEMTEAYNDAACFLRLTPAMPMPALANTVDVGPVGRRGRNRRAEIDARLGLAPGHRLVLLFLGGIPTALPLADWPQRPNLTWLVPPGKWPHRPDVVALDTLGLDYIDVLASADALVTKPGYGSVVDAAVNAVPLLYVRRRNWPEEPFLIDWLTRHGRCREIEPAALKSGELTAPLAALWEQQPPPPVAPSGIAAAADHLERLLPLG